MVERGLAETRSQAQALVLAGKVTGHAKAGEQVDETTEIEVESGPRFVSRGGEKLANALATFVVDVEGEDCLDVGASTGGFTDCLLQAGAARVCALDVGYGQLHPKLRDDPRVTVMERMNVRNLDCEELPFRPSLRHLRRLLHLALEGACRRRSPARRRAGGRSFSSSRSSRRGAAEVGKGGVVRDPEVHRASSTRSPRGPPSGEPGSGRPPTRACPARRETVSSSSTSRAAAERDPTRSPDRRALHATAARSGSGTRRRRVERLAAEAGVELTSLGEGSPDLVVALGGDGTMLRALRATLGSRDPRLRRELRPHRLSHERRRPPARGGASRASSRASTRRSSSARSPRASPTGRRSRSTTSSSRARSRGGWSSSAGRSAARSSAPSPATGSSAARLRARRPTTSVERRARDDVGARRDGDHVRGAALPARPPARPATRARPQRDEPVRRSARDRPRGRQVRRATSRRAPESPSSIGEETASLAVLPEVSFFTRYHSVFP